MNDILSPVCMWIHSICTTGELSKFPHNVSNLNKLHPEKQSWLSLIFHIPLDDVSPQYSLHYSFRSPPSLSAPLPAPSSPSLGAGVPTLTTPQGPCPHHEILRASWPLTHSLQLSKLLWWLCRLTFPWETRAKLHTQTEKQKHCGKLSVFCYKR